MIRVIEDCEGYLSTGSRSSRINLTFGLICFISDGVVMVGSAACGSF